MLAIEYTLRLVEFGLLFGGLPCCSFIWLNRSTSMRSAETPLGDELKLYIRQANLSLGLRTITIFYVLYTTINIPTYIIIYIICYSMRMYIFHSQWPCIALLTEASDKNSDALCPMYGQICTLGFRAARIFYICLLPLPETPGKGHGEVCAHSNQPLVGC